jgi:hypothetical protein
MALPCRFARSMDYYAHRNITLLDELPIEIQNMFVIADQGLGESPRSTQRACLEAAHGGACVHGAQSQAQCRARGPGARAAPAGMGSWQHKRQQLTRCRQCGAVLQVSCTATTSGRGVAPLTWTTLTRTRASRALRLLRPCRRAPGWRWPPVYGFPAVRGRAASSRWRTAWVQADPPSACTRRP